MAPRPITELRPREIVEARDRTGIIFIPISPAFEWHSYHLPLGTDAIIAEALSSLAAERTGGLYFPAMSFGTDEWRTSESLAKWGFGQDERVFGMRFPRLPLASEYCEKEDMIRALGSRFECVRLSGFRYVFIVNNHGGRGQAKSLNEFARTHNSPPCRLCYIQVQDLVADERLSCGGHANLDNETAVLMGFRPELVNLGELPEGELRVQEHGILHSRPVIPPELNPRHTSFLGANERRQHLVDRLTDVVQAVVAGDPMTGNAGPDPF